MLNIARLKMENKNNFSAEKCSIVKRFRTLTKNKPGEVVLKYLNDENTQSEITYIQLDQAALKLSVVISEIGNPGDRVLIAIDNGINFVIALWATLYANRVAVPVSVPAPFKPNIYLDNFSSISRDCNATICLSETSTKDFILRQPQQKYVPSELKWLSVSVANVNSGHTKYERYVNENIVPDDIALILYTSGSTGRPKGAVYRHDTLNEMIPRKVGVNLGRPIVRVNWYPLAHATGLFHTLKTQLGEDDISMCLMSPNLFLRSPLSWLQMISNQGSSVSVSTLTPNFAFDHCVSGTTELERSQLDLSNWRIIASTGEQVRPESLDRFFTAFYSAKLRPQLVISTYGLSEVSIVSSAVIGSGDFISIPRWFYNKAISFDREQIECGYFKEAKNGSYRILSSGKCNSKIKIAIVDPITSEILPENRIGEIWISKKNSAENYWNALNTTNKETLFNNMRKELKGKYFRTGDIGGIYKSELFITGRLKNVMIFRGRNVYAEDIEIALKNNVDKLSGIPVVAFSHEVDNSEKLVLALEINQFGQNSEKKLIDDVRAVISKEFGLHLFELLMFPYGQLPRTPASGKVAREYCKKLYMNGELENQYPDVRRSSTRYIGSSLNVIREEFGESDGPQNNDLSLNNVDDICRHIQLSLSAMLSMPINQISFSASFQELGIDSVGIASLCAKLNNDLGIPIPEEYIFNYPSIQELAVHLCSCLRT